MMPPPIGSKNWNANYPTPPLSRWVTVDEFDNVVLCKLALNKMSDKADHRVQKLRQEWLYGRPDSHEMIDKFFAEYNQQLDLFIQQMNAGCVATDDPRLKER